MAEVKFFTEQQVYSKSSALLDLRLRVRPRTGAAARAPRGSRALGGQLRPGWLAPVAAAAHARRAARPRP
jgi:hypothetical protein